MYHKTTGTVEIVVISVAFLLIFDSVGSFLSSLKGTAINRMGMTQVSAINCDLWLNKDGADPSHKLQALIEWKSRKFQP